MNAGMAAPVAMAALVSDECDKADCAAHETSGALCYAVCGGTLAVLAASTWCVSGADKGLTSLAVTARSGHSSPPDLSPPRPAVLR